MTYLLYILYFRVTFRVSDFEYISVIYQLHDISVSKFKVTGIFIKHLFHFNKYIDTENR